MSIALMTAAFKTQLNSTRKFVLVALCDNANDQGECFPSVSMLCQKTSLGERAIQGALSFLVSEGYLRRDMRVGRSTYYFITDPRTWCTPAQDAPPQQVHPTPAAGAPITTIEPPIEPSGNHQKRAKVAPDEFDPVAVLLEAEVDRQTVDDWLKHRKAKRASISMTVIKDRAKQAALAGIDLADALQMEISRGWQGFEAAWVVKPPARGSPPNPQNPQLGKAGQETALAAQRLREKMGLAK